MKEIENLSFEEALNELESLVRRLEEGKVNLEEAISSYENGTALRMHCTAKLREARMRVEKIVVGENGTPSTEPFSSD